MQQNDSLADGYSSPTTTTNCLARLQSSPAAAGVAAAGAPGASAPLGCSRLPRLLLLPADRGLSDAGSSTIRLVLINADIARRVRTALELGAGQLSERSPLGPFRCGWCEALLELANTVSCGRATLLRDVDLRGLWPRPPDGAVCASPRQCATDAGHSTIDAQTAPAGRKAQQ